MATPTTTAAIEADISTWRVPVARHQTLDEARTSDDGTTVSRTSDAKSLQARHLGGNHDVPTDGGSEVVMPFAESPTAGGSEVVIPDAESPTA